MTPSLRASAGSWFGFGRKSAEAMYPRGQFALSRQLAPAALAGIVLVSIGLGTAFVKTQVNADPQMALIEQIIGRLAQDDAQWTNDVLSVQLGILPNYDQVAAPIYALERGRSDLRHASELLPLPPAEIERLAILEREATAVMMSKVELAGRIAAQYAVLSNSTRFLPVAAGELMQAAASPDLPVEQALALSRMVMQVSGEILGGQYQPQPQPRGLPQAAVDMQRLAAGLPEDLARAVRIFLLHSGIIIEQRQLGARLMTDLRALPVTPLMDALHNTYAQHRSRLAAENRVWRTAVVVLAVLLAGLLAYVGWQLRRNYAQVTDANRQLRQDQADTQALLAQSSKMSSLGQMVAGIAHEINTPLAYLQATMSMLKELLENSLNVAGDERQLSEMLARRQQADEGTLFDDIRVLLADGEHGSQRIAELVRSLKNFARRDDSAVGLFVLAELAESALTISNHKTKNVARVERQYQAVPKVRCSPSQIVQVLLNLIGNALHAMEGRDGHGVLTVRIWAQGDNSVRLDVSDNGTGIAPETLKHIFDPFFSTKKVGEGTGLGLSICQRIMNDHTGQLLVRSELGTGTTFSMVLPAGTASPQAPRQLPAVTAATHS